MPTPKTDDIKKHGDTLEPLIDRAGTSTHRDRNANDDARRQDDAEDRRDVGARE